MHELSRRDFLRAGAFGTGALAVSAFGGEKLAGAFERFEGYLDSLDYLDGLKPSPNPLPKTLQGLTLNSPFLWSYDDSYVEWVSDHAKNLGAHAIRIFINDDFEPTLENRNDSVLENIKRISGLLGNTKLIVSMFDAYTLLHSDKPSRDIPPKPLSSPYFLGSPGETKEEKQISFFKNGDIKSCFHERVEYIVKSLKDVEQIEAWEIANEVELTDTRTLTKWYNENVVVIRSQDSARPIITGLAKPWLINEKRLLGKNIVNSFHIYPFQMPVMEGLTKFAPNSRLPLVGLEVGVSRDVEKIFKYPMFIFQVFRSLISENTLYAGGLGLWKIGQNPDGYDLSDTGDSKYFARLSRKLKSVQTR